jgi:hypothetical protein
MRWTNEDDFLNHIGEYRLKKVDKRILLKGYLKGLNLRSDFGELNKDKIEAEARKCLHDLKPSLPGGTSGSLGARKTYPVLSARIQK